MKSKAQLRELGKRQIKRMGVHLELAECYPVDQSILKQGIRFQKFIVKKHHKLKSKGQH